MRTDTAQCCTLHTRADTFAHPHTAASLTRRRGACRRWAARPLQPSRSRFSSLCAGLCRGAARCACSGLAGSFVVWFWSTCAHLAAVVVMRFLVCVVASARRHAWLERGPESVDWPGRHCHHPARQGGFVSREQVSGRTCCSLARCEPCGVLSVDSVCFLSTHAFCVGC